MKCTTVVSSLVIQVGSSLTGDWAWGIQMVSQWIQVPILLHLDSENWR